MSLGHHHAWLPPGHLRPPDDSNDMRALNGFSRSSSRPRTPQKLLPAGADASQSGNHLISDTDVAVEDDPRLVVFRDLYKQSEAKIAALFDPSNTEFAAPGGNRPDDDPMRDAPADESAPSQSSAPAKRPARKIDDDDYDEYDDEGDGDIPDATPSRKPVSTGPIPASSPRRPGIASNDSVEGTKETSKESLEDIRKKLEEDKKATEEAARRSFHTMFYTLENDRDAMLDQQRLEESERQVEAEMSGQNANNSHANNESTGYGSLSNANLGASSLTLKNLIARIDMKRTMVQASDAELRSLMSEVRKNRSKWASEEKVGQEELYESAEKVLSELKAMTEHSSAFLTRVNKREAPDYYNIIKHPMDLGTMTKKLKGLQYKSKQEFVEDVNLIWANCLKYNANPDHFLRKHALYMKKETEKLVPLIPEIVIRDRAEVEAEERRAQLAELDGGEESDDEPIMSSRGRKAPGKGTKKGTAPSRGTAPASGSEPPSAGPAGSQSNALFRADSDVAMEGSQNGFATPPPGTATPSGPNGIGSAAPGSQADTMEIDGFSSGLNGVSSALSAGIEVEDPEYKVWKQVTKKDRAIIAAERHKLFKGDKLNPDEPALLRTKAGMRRWVRSQKVASDDAERSALSTAQAKEPDAGGETLAEGIEEEEDKMIPDYYDVMSAIPDLPEQLHWVEDAEGNVVDASEEFLRVLPKGSFTAPDSKLSKKMDANMRQLQETRKVCSKIGIVKQMQLQSQMYQNQFQKYNPEPFVEHDVPIHVMNDEGPVISPWVCKAALQRTVGKLFYNAGFEEYQPSALDAVTDIAADFFTKIGSTLRSYMETPKVPANPPGVSQASSEWKPAYTTEEMILHTLSSVGTDIETLEFYVKDDVDRLASKLGVVHERMRAHLTDLLRPALNDGGADGSNAFHDGSEQFVGGDFAEDIDEDFFGFKELGLDKEFGLASLSVPLHLLQNRMFHAHQAQNTNSTQTCAQVFPTPPQYPRISMQTLPSQIGLVQNFFLAKLHANSDEPLVEDLELPPKQRPTAARPRLPATGKIPPPTGSGGVHSSPQKRPPPSSANTAPSAVKPGLSGEPSKKKLKRNSGVAATLDGATDESGKVSSLGHKSVEKSKPGPDDNAAEVAPGNGSTNANAKSGSENSGVVDGGEFSSSLGPNKVNGTSNTATNGADEGQNSASGANTTAAGASGSGGLISPESINGHH